MANNEETKTTGLEASSNFAQDEKNLIAALLEAADYKSAKDENTKSITIKKNGKPLFTFRVRALSQTEIQSASKKATKQLPNPAGPKYPHISGERNTASYHNYLIYSATIEEDRAKIWNNAQIKDKYNILDSADSVDVLLTAGTKSKVVDEILALSGFDGEDVVDEEDYIKN